MFDDNKLLKSAKTGTRRAGRKDLIEYLSGKRLTRHKAIQAKCYDCDGMGESGLCDIDTCSLFPYSPYSSPQEKETNHA